MAKFKPFLEVVISCNDGSGTHTKEEALARIAEHWEVEETIPN